MPQRQEKASNLILIELSRIEVSEKSEGLKSIIELQSEIEEVKNHSYNYLKEFWRLKRNSAKFHCREFSNLTTFQSKSHSVSNQPDTSAAKSLQNCRNR